MDINAAQRFAERQRVLWLIPAFLAVHNLEEALTMRWALPLMRSAAPAIARPYVTLVTYQQMLAALAIATVVPLSVALWAIRRRESKAALWSALLVQAVVALNVLSHLMIAAIIRGYGPGLVTAVAINLPFSVYVFRRVVRERWLSRQALGALVPAAVMVHGPALIGLILLAGSLVR